LLKLLVTKHPVLQLSSWIIAISIHQGFRMREADGTHRPRQPTKLITGVTDAPAWPVLHKHWRSSRSATTQSPDSSAPSMRASS